MNPLSVLNPITSPIADNVLIEASAGTGKTYTITTLFLRLLLGINIPHKTPLLINEILVVTFTNAATAELKKRIYERIIAMRACLMGLPTEDETLNELALALKGTEALSLQRLLIAERAIDQASIFTIHAFCQRILTQNALTSRLNFELTLTPSLNDLFLKATKQFWRKECYQFDSKLSLLAADIYQSPEKLLARLASYLNHSNFSIRQEIPESGAELNQNVTKTVDALDEIKIEWLGFVNDFTALFESSDINKRSYNARNLPNWLNTVTDWARSDDDFPLPKELHRFSQAILLENAKDLPPKHALFKKIEGFLAHDIYAELQESLLLFARFKIDEEINLLKDKEGVFGFDDILFYTDQLLQSAPESLLETLRNSYKAAMIDEFQDTDQHQFSIFQRIFSKGYDRPLLMIGDPKQSIYKFRGADIYTYLNAKNSAQYHYTLGVNYRSATSVVEATNQLFKKNENPFLEKEIPFIAVLTPESARAMHLSIKGVKQKGVTVQYLDESVSNTEYLTTLADHTALEISELLREGKLHNQDNQHQVNPKDIALLVRSGREADFLKQSLNKLSINCVYLSEKNSVFSSTAAMDLLIFLKSLLNPRNYPLIRRTIASPLYHLSLSELDGLLNNHEAYEALILERKALIEIWQRQGILAMMRAFIQQNERLSRIKNRTDYERLLTDIFHLSERLQTQSFTLSTAEALILWFEEMIQSQGDIGDASHLLRLESELDVVTIITIHKSKGLEYPIVFIPFALTTPQFEEFVYHDRETQKTYLSFNKDSAITEQIEHEAAAENVRLLYVAITRAKYHCRIGVAAELLSRKQPITHTTALGKLLNLSTESPITPSLFNSEWIDCLLIKNEDRALVYQPDQAEYSLLTPAKLTRAIDHFWQLTSFSQLTRHIAHSFFDHGEGEKSDEYDELEEANIYEKIGKGDDQTQNQQNYQNYSPFNFPRGAYVGTFLHDLFEKNPPTALMDQKIIKEQLRNTIFYHELKGALDEWSVALTDWMTDILHAPLTAQLSLNTLFLNKHIQELEFLFPINKLINAKQLNKLLNSNPKRTTPAALDFYKLNGMLKGFIDLIFEWEGKFYIADYKSNHLGNSYDDYEQKPMQIAMDSAYYDAQYLIYTVALVRHLRLFNPDFNYETQFGGVFYLFLRGMNQQNDQGVYFIKPELSVINALDDLFSKGGHNDS